MLHDSSLVVKAVAHADQTEVHLANDADPQKLLQRLIESGASISKFEKIEPSLNDIFIEAVES